MGPSNVPKPEVKIDPSLAEQSARATADQTDALQLRLKQDTASVMARYGTRLAMANGTAPPLGSPLQAA